MLECQMTTSSMAASFSSCCFIVNTSPPDTIHTWLIINTWQPLQNHSKAFLVTYTIYLYWLQHAQHLSIRIFSSYISELATLSMLLWMLALHQYTYPVYEYKRHIVQIKLQHTWAAVHSFFSDSLWLPHMYHERHLLEDRQGKMPVYDM